MKFQAGIINLFFCLFLDDMVFVSLFAQKHLSFQCEILLKRVLRDNRIEIGLVSFCFRAQDPSEPLSFLLPGAKGARDLNSD